MNLKSITIEDKEIFAKFLEPYTFATHEYCFTNLFIWKKYCDICYTFLKDALILKKKDYAGNHVFFMQPIRYKKEDLPDIVNELTAYSHEHSHQYLFRDVELSFVNDLVELFPGRFIIEFDMADADYIYDTETFIRLPGNKFRAHKNHINHFVKNNNYTTLPLTSINTSDCIGFARQWCEIKSATGSLSSESDALTDLFKNISKLNYQGMIVTIDNIIAAFIVGERLNVTTSVIHIEKALPQYKGLYNFLKKTFVESYFSDTQFVNWEQDLGIDGLRNAKMSYKPCRLEKKYAVKEK